MPIVSKRKLALLALVAGATLASALALFGFGHEPVARSAASSVSTSPLGSYSVLARPARATDTIANWRAAQTPNPVGLQIGAARIIQREQSRTVALAPSTLGPCLVMNFADGSGGVVCGRNNEEPAISLGYNGALGVVPDSVKSVELTMEDGTVTTRAVQDNVWRSPADAAKVAIDLPTGRYQAALTPRSSVPPAAQLHPDGLVTSPGSPPKEAPEGD